LSLLGLASVVHIAFSHPVLEMFSAFSLIISALFLSLFTGLSWYLFKRYDNLNNLDEALQKIEEKRVKLEDKLVTK